jgi:hypothetical protein
MFRSASFEILFHATIKLFGDDPSGRESVDLRQPGCWDCFFESRRGHECLSVVSIVCCQVEVSASG